MNSMVVNVISMTYSTKVVQQGFIRELTMQGHCTGFRLISQTLKKRLVSVSATKYWENMIKVHQPLYITSSLETNCGSFYMNPKQNLNRLYGASKRTKSNQIFCRRSRTNQIVLVSSTLLVTVLWEQLRRMNFELFVCGDILKISMKRHTKQLTWSTMFNNLKNSWYVNVFEVISIRMEKVVRELVQMSARL